MGVELGSAVGKIEIDATGVTQGVQAAQDALRGAQSSLASIGGAATSAGAGLMTLGAPLVAFGGVAAKVAGDFEGQMNILAVAAKGGSTSLDDLRNVAIQAGADVSLVGVGAADVAGAMTNFAKAGLDTNQMLGDMQGYLAGTTQLGGALRAAIDLAAASELDLEQASSLVVTTMSTFGLSADEAVGAMNNYVQAADASVASVSDLAAAMSNIGPTMAQFGIPLEDVNTGLAILSTRGITGAEAGTALKSMMTNMMRGTTDVDAALKGLNVSLYDANGNMRSLPDIIAQVERGMKGMTEEQKNANMQTIFGTYGMKAAATLLGEGAAGWDKMSDAIKNGASMQETAAARTQGFNASMEQLKSAVETFMITAGTPLIRDVLTPLVQTLTKVIGGLANVNPEFIKLAVAAGAVLVGLGGLLVTFGKVAGAISNIMTLVRIVGPLFAGLGPMIGGALSAVGAALAPLLPIILAVAAVAGLLYLAWKTNFLGIRDIMQQVGYAITAVFDFIKGVVGGFIRFLNGEITWDQFVAHVKDIFGDLRDNLGEIFDNIAERLRAAWARIQEAAARIWEAIKQVIIQKLAEFLAPIFGGVEQARQKVTEAFENVRAFLAGVWEGIKTAAGSAWDWIKARFEEAKETIRTVMAAIVAILSGDWQTAVETIRTRVQEIWTAITSKFTEIVDAVRTKLQEIWAAIVGKWEEIKAGALTTVQGIIDGIVGFFTGLVGKIGEVMGQIVAKIAQAWEDVKGFVNKLFGRGEAGPETAADAAQAAAMAAQWKAAVEEVQAAWVRMQTTVTTIATAMQAFITTWLTTLSVLFLTQWTTIQTNLAQTWTNMQLQITMTTTALTLLLTTWLTTLSVLFLTQWTTIQTNLAQTWTNMQLQITTTTTALMVSLTTWLAELVAVFFAQWTTIRTNTTTLVEEMRAAVVAIVTQMAEQIKGVLNGLVGAAGGAGAALGNALADGIRSSIPAAVAAAQALAAAVRANLPGSDAEEGPLSDLTASGRALPETLGAGIRANMAAMVGAARAMAGAVNGVLPTGGAVSYALRNISGLGELMAQFSHRIFGNAALAASVAGASAPVRLERPGGKFPTRQPEWPPQGRPDVSRGTPNTDKPRPEQTINVTINNPVGETADNSIVRQLRNLAYIGVLNPGS